jgi:hypothetical protein
LKSTNIVYRETDRRTLGAKHRELARSSPDKFLKPGQLRGAVLITSSYLKGRDKRKKEICGSYEFRGY